MLFVFKKVFLSFLLFCFITGLSSGCSECPELISDSTGNRSGYKKTATGTAIAENAAIDITEDEVEEKLSKSDTGSTSESDGFPEEEVPAVLSGESIFTFAVAGDNRPADDTLPQPGVFIDLLGHIKDSGPIFFINTGDIINGATDDEQTIIRQYSDYLEAVKVLNVINPVSPGNHDVSNNTSRKCFIKMVHEPVLNLSDEKTIKIYKGSKDLIGENIIDSRQIETGLLWSHPDSLYYCFRVNDVYFIILDAYEPGCWGAIQNEQLAWLEAVIEYLEDEDVFIFIHPPPYSYLNPDCITDGSLHVAFSSKKNQDHIRRLFREYRVDAVFSGHEHMYNRQVHDGTEYIITGCSGAYPYASEEEGGFYHFLKIEVKKDSWTLNVIDSKGELFSSEEILF